MVEDANPLILGSQVTFENGQAARLASMEVDEDWEVLNVGVTRGFLRWKERVRLPFTVAKGWTENSLALTCNGDEAFRREVPPIAAPARPVSSETPIATGDARLLGALVVGPTRRVLGAIIRAGARRIRVPVAHLSFEGKVLHITAPLDTLPEYRSDAEIADKAWRMLKRDTVVAPAELRTIGVGAAGGVLLVTGNVRRKHTREHLERLVSAVPGATRVDSQIADDLAIETELGWALERAGIQRSASIFARSSLGEVTLFGQAPSAKVVEDATRVATDVAGVRSVASRVETGAAPQTAAA